jgi:CMP/dCMP kinase
MIITVSGKAGSGKSTVAKTLGKRLGLRHYSVGDVMRKMASEREISLLDLNKLAEKDPSIDKELDDRLIRLGKTEDGFIIDGRLTAFFIPHAKFRIFLSADAKTRAERILKAKRADEQNETLAQTMKSMEKREESERKRYKQYYDVDYTDKKLYTHVVDTTTLGVEGVLSQILSFVKN